jgi:hypothetical protein
VPDEAASPDPTALCQSHSLTCHVALRRSGLNHIDCSSSRSPLQKTPWALSAIGRKECMDIFGTRLSTILLPVDFWSLWSFANAKFQVPVSNEAGVP